MTRSSIKAVHCRVVKEFLPALCAHSLRCDSLWIVPHEHVCKVSTVMHTFLGWIRIHGTVQMEVSSIFAPIDVRSRYTVCTPTSIMFITVLEVLVVCARPLCKWFG